MTITLCMIAGREAAHIETVLRSFAPAYDQLSLVLALGNQEADETEAIARKVCAELRKVVMVSTYKNAKGNDWPHVDDFAAARQQSFMQGASMQSDWLFWADADDEASPDIGDLRRICETATADHAFGFPYDVRGSGKRPIRERLFRASAFTSGEVRWTGIVHENIVGAKVMAMESPVWIHAPKEAKSQSKERNLRLLKSANKDAALHSFYIHQEHHLKGDTEGVRKWGEAALAMPGLPDQFRYEVYLNFTRHRIGDMMTWAAKAFALFPACREALACMAFIRMEEGQLDHALTLAERLVAMPLPTAEKRPWSYEAKWYGWAGDDLLARLRRLNGLPAAEPTPIISLIHATRGRVNGAIAARDRWMNMADNAAAIETIWCVDEDDKKTVAIAKQFPHVIVPAGGGCVAAWNAGAFKARGKLFVQLSDDWIPCQGWDTKLLAEIENLDAPAVVAVSDGHRTDDLLCMAILTRARWEAQGCEMFSGEYLSVYSDNEFSVRAFADGVVIDARPRITFEHAHPAFGRAASDKTYEESNSVERYRHGLATFNRRNPAHAITITTK